ncbi:DUF2062 domain-containing protein [Desulfocapsa sp. AH-315-G09]|uniref:DUF2062 domain-containing protein n=1 Tax=Desulfotalea psychrophila TaxID=84980 RepID=A0ABS3ASK7_9BACT|nr:DUF2062 domain-containing protein [Desulfocapsa sp.]MBN4063892.1 DUF2062 domain-containing protein [bacterium AH-315-I07]MBN4065022.1 DUF2062 domain-containing protein [Desulfocapsa sp. AH-315-G09]MBN4068109.1 DUF2062 domain-containing protein [Desulfotalea psychrophila]
MKFTRLKQYYYLKFLRIKGDPRDIALGAFIGAMIGTMPVMPFHTIGIIAVCFLTRTSAIAGLFSSLVISNPFSYIPIYYISMVIGNFITPYEVSWTKIHSILDVIISGRGFKESVHILTSQGYELIIVMMSGGLVLAIPTAIFWYVFTLRLFLRIREKRRQKQILREKNKKIKKKRKL